MKTEGALQIEPHFFSEKETLFCDLGELRASLFIYNTGVRGVKISNSRGHVVVLPYKGQQIWDACFNSRNLTMRSMFEEPKNVTFFLNTYGCFMMHCGALRMGCPGSEDDHPLHGELPYADYESAQVIFGEDERGEYMGISGTYNHDVAFTAHYTAQPSVKVYRDSGVIEITMKIKNRASYPMELMYMCHVNFLPVDHGRIIQSVPWDPEHFVLRTSIPAHVKVSKQFLDFLDKLKAEPGLTRELRPGDVYKPEVAFFIQSPKTDKEGYSHFMQLHPDDSADYIAYKPVQLDHAARWIMRTGDQEALGLALPSTCDPEGYTAEKKKGNVKEIPGQSDVAFTIITGGLDQKEAQDMERHINKILSYKTTL